MLVKHLVKQSLLSRNGGALCRAAYHVGDEKQSTMNDLPVPEGDWYEQHKRLNAKYNTYLIVGILSLIGTISVAKSTGLIHLNFYPPKSID